MLDLAALYQSFHRFPELSGREVETTKRIKEILSSLEGVRLRDLGLPTGVLAEVGSGKAPFVLLRADIDALPIEEDTTVPYKSEHPGCMHACGHDYHLTNLLGAAEYLASRRNELQGTVLLLFQPAEESGGGAKQVVATGLFKRYPVSACFGLHIQPMLKAGTIALCDGAISAAVDRWSVTVAGKGTHGAHPELGLDPIPACCRLVESLEEIPAKRLSPLEPALVSVTHFASGSSWNTLSGEALLEGTNRTFSSHAREVVKQAFEEQVAALEAQGFTVALNLKWGTPATNNDPKLTDFVRTLARQYGFELVELDGGEMGGEDFSYYQALVPGTFFHVGVDGSYPLHSPRLAINPGHLPETAAFLGGLASTYLSSYVPNASA